MEFMFVPAPKWYWGPAGQRRIQSQIPTSFHKIPQPKNAPIKYNGKLERWTMIILPLLTTSFVCFSCTFFNLGVKGSKHYGSPEFVLYWPYLSSTLCLLMRPIVSRSVILDMPPCVTRIFELTTVANGNQPNTSSYNFRTLAECSCVNRTVLRII